MTLSKRDVLELVSRNSEAIRALGVERLRLFGSFVRDQAAADSDVDFLVEFAPGHKSFDNFIGLAHLLEDLFHRRVELVTPESLSPYIGPHILQEAERVDFAA